MVDEILSQVAEWQTSLADWLALQSQREQGACADLCSGGVEAAGLGRFDAESGVWRLVDDRWQAGNKGGLHCPFRLAAGLTPHRPLGAGGPECLGDAPCAECQPRVEEVSCGPGQGGVFREGRFVEKDSKLYEITLAVGLVESDERFSSFEFDFLGDELVRWERSGETCGLYPVEAVNELGAWLLEFLQHAEPLVKRVADLSVGLSQEQGRKAWAALESEVTALRRIVGGSGSPAGSEAAGSFVLLAKVLDLRLLRVRGWGFALKAWRSASAAGRSGSRVQAGRGGSSSSGPSGPC